MAKPSLSPGMTNLHKGLQRMQYWLTRDETSPVIVATATLQAFKQQKLPPHVHATPQKRHGMRLMVRGGRRYHDPEHKLAVWPQDDLDENLLPFVMFVLDGQADFNLGDYVLHCRMGDIILVPPGVPKENGSKSHVNGEGKDRSCDILWILTSEIKTAGLGSWICRSVGQEHIKNDDLGYAIVEGELLARLFNGFCEEMQGERNLPIAKQLLKTALLILQNEIATGRVFERLGNEGQFPRHQSEVEADHFLKSLHISREAKKEQTRNSIAEAMAYMEVNLHRRLTIDSVAHQVLISPASLRRGFKEQTGDTFHEYLTKLRLRNAGELLTNTLLPIQDVGMRVGLKSGQFWALFHKHYGCSPSEYRARRN